MSKKAERIAGRFRVERELGQGAAATVYAVIDERLGVLRALKRLSPAMTRYARMRTRLVAEARAMARLTHPHVVRVFDVFIDNDDACIVMELVEGGSVVSLLQQQGALPPKRAIGLMGEILSALHAAHQAGIIHRDIKPHNVLLDAHGRARVTDFGVARFLNEDENLTRTGVTMGTWAFMAPEQRADARSVDHRADIYSAGATLYALLTATTPKDLFAADLDPSLLADIPPPLARVIQRATSYHRDARYHSAEAMAEDLLVAAGELNVSMNEPLEAPAPDPATSVLVHEVSVTPALTAVANETMAFEPFQEISPAEDDHRGPLPVPPQNTNTGVQLLALSALFVLALSTGPSLYRIVFPSSAPTVYHSGVSIHDANASLPSVQRPAAAPPVDVVAEPTQTATLSAEPAVVEAVSAPVEAPIPAPVVEEPSAPVEDVVEHPVESSTPDPVPPSVEPSEAPQAAPPVEVAAVTEEPAQPVEVEPDGHDNDARAALVAVMAAAVDEEGPEPAPDRHAPAPTDEDLAEESLDGPSRIVPRIDAPVRLGPADPEEG